MSSSTQDAIRRAALEAGWTIKARLGDEYAHSRGTGRWDRDIFQIGRVDRHLADGTPVTECEHAIDVFYTHGGAVSSVYAHQFTVPKVIYGRGIMPVHGERDKAARVIAALRARTSVIPTEVDRAEMAEAEHQLVLRRLGLDDKEGMKE